ncbi:MAG: GlsB/YeaQ/YmgE family stress response membrane protein [Candidatus Dormibacterales bacterium]
MELAPGGILLWLLVGLIAGWAAGQVSRGHGFGVVGNIIIGLVGALLGGYLAGFLITGTVGFIGSVVVAFFGAVVLLTLVRVVGGGRIRT